MDKIYYIYNAFFNAHDITLDQLNKYISEGYELHINPDTIIWDSEVKFAAKFEDNLFIMVRPKGYNEAEAEDNPFFDEWMGDDEDESDDDIEGWN